MGNLEQFMIFFDNPQGVHHAGQLLRGTVVVQLSQGMKMRGISVKLLGRSIVKWEVRHAANGDQPSHTDVYQAIEVYFEEVFTLFGLPGNRDATVLQAGRYEFPFSFLLPTNVPSSFEGKVGHVRYIATAKIDKPWKFDHVTKAAFTVLRSLDLNLEDTSTREPFTLTSQEIVSCCCCVSGSVNTSVTINKRCFVPGETVYINGEIANNTNTTVRRCRASLKQHIRFTASKKHILFSGSRTVKNVKSYQVNVEGAPISPGEVGKWINVPLVIPSLPPSRLDGCGIIDISYKFKFYVDVDYTHIKLNTDILIGTIPLQGTFYSYAPLVGPPPVITQQPTAPLSRDVVQPYQQPYGQPPSADYYAPLPTYEECVMGKVPIKEKDDSEYVRGNLLWAPMYPTYHFPTGHAGDGRMLPMGINDRTNN